MRDVVDSLRRRLEECRQPDASLEVLRALQLEILDIAKKLQRETELGDVTSSGTMQPRAALWSMLGESFWLERDPDHLTTMIERVIAEIENEVSRASPSVP